MKKRDVIIEFIGVCFIGLSIIIFIPILLNFVLQCNTPRGCVIGGNDAPNVWLGFWGTYIGAIGSIIIAYVSYRQSRSESKRASLISEIEQERTLYRNLEILIEKEIAIHSVARIYEIMDAVRNPMKYSILLNRLKTDLQCASTHCAYFHQVVTSREYMNFGNQLSKLNLKFIDIINANNFTFTNKDVESLELQLAKLVKSGFDVLLEQNKKITNLQKKLQEM